MAELFNMKLPFELVDIIKLYTGEAYERNDRIYPVVRIPKTDDRYSMLLKRPKIKQLPNRYYEYSKAGSTWFKLPNGKFIVITVKYGHHWDMITRLEGIFWEMDYNSTKTTIYIGR